MLIKTIRKYKKISFALPATFDPIKDALETGVGILAVVGEGRLELLEVDGELMPFIDKLIEEFKKDNVLLKSYEKISF